MLDSLRARLTLWYAAVLAVALVIFALLLYGALARQLYAHHDEELAAHAEHVQRLAGGEGSAQQITAAITGLREGPALLMLRDSSGRMVYRSPALAAGDAGLGEHDALVHAAMQGRTVAQFFTTRLEGIGTVRFICVPARGADGVYLQIGQPLGDVDETLRFFVTAALILIPVALALTSVGGFVLARRALTPVERIRSALEAIQAEDLSRRIDAHPREAELGRLVMSVNALLDRLARAFASLREFAGDASHQLQTPLTVMKGSVEVALSTPRAAASYRGTLEEVAQEVDTMVAILADLRTLSLADAPVVRRTDARVNLSEVFSEAADIISALGESAGVAVETTVAPGVFAHGDPVRLQQVVFNLGENAVKYSRPGDRVRIALAREGAEAVLTISDSGVGIAAADLPHIFDRFYRARGTGHRTDGSGLGLAIVRRIVEAHGGRVAAQAAPGSGATFTVHLPLASP
ncbi:MAG TPA: ATP-binding protein [Gemmatimonadaceae bacterium]|nr:ATP-binding protein [Gemmatimonadaceae bacterium]